MKTYSPTNSMIVCVENTGDYVKKIEVEELIIKSARLAESILMDWDRGMQIELARRIASITHELFLEEQDMKITDARIGMPVNCHGMTMYITGIFTFFSDLKDPTKGTLYLEFEGNEGDIWEEDVKDVEPIESLKK